MERGDVRRRSKAPRVFRLAFGAAVCVLIATRADTGAARAETGGVAEENSRSCGDAVAAAEASFGIPPRLLRAVALVESGRKDPETGNVAAWPWTLNVEGEGQYHPTKADAVAALHRLRDQGVASVDVGCLQINLHYHHGVFSSMEQALDPEQNARYGASFLRALYAATGSWSSAVRRYHSATPDLGEAYMARVMAAWQHLGGRPTLLSLPPATSAAGLYVQADVIARILAEAGIPVPAEIVYLQMQGRLRPAKSAPPGGGAREVRNGTDERPGYDATAARERFVNPWAAPTVGQDSAGAKRPQAPTATSGYQAGRPGFGSSGYGRSRDEGMQRPIPASRFDRRPGSLP